MAAERQQPPGNGEDALMAFMGEEPFAHLYEKCANNMDIVGDVGQLDQGEVVRELSRRGFLNVRHLYAGLQSVPPGDEA